MDFSSNSIALASVFLVFLFFLFSNLDLFRYTQVLIGKHYAITVFVSLPLYYFYKFRNVGKTCTYNNHFMEIDSKTKAKNPRNPKLHSVCKHIKFLDYHPDTQFRYLTLYMYENVKQALLKICQ